MRLVLVLVFAGMVALPLRASSQVGQEAQTAESRELAFLPEHLSHPLRQRPKRPAAEPALKLEVDSTALEVTPTAPPTLEELELQEKKRRRRAIGIGVGVTVGVVLVGLAIGAGVAAASIDI